ncbi:beta-N-acetylhexosaminidase [Microbulbifer sp. CAU 1566]|uniref:beta-N-acetylhexosaminidase n=1 Tax=Microbulbifer sp. CAU 1566 TaxID=2933269 RepID=UPI00200353F8|nr:family 20 glycosylhydrolase [Microbulbifer sp. CAU 1566]MCK7596229.1 beta-N-acetylhexosaminidase [Microbulbifer sp. CAU 1566]
MGNRRSNILTLTAAVTLILPPFANAKSSEYSEYDARLPAMMPYPHQVDVQPTAPMRLEDSSQICLPPAASTRLNDATDRFRERLQRQQNIQLAVARPCAEIPDSDVGSRIELVLTSPDYADENTLAALSGNRAFYRLQVTANKVQLSAHTEIGLLHGLQTLSQYIGSDKSGVTAGYEMLPGIQIEDQPRFRWRGLMLDSVRHFFSVETIKRQLDGMAAAKLNVFHWHLTDDQGWRLQSHAYPKLHETAPGGNFYTHEQVRDIVAYAAARGIVVVPEIDMPGHTSAIAVAYPELMSAPGPYAPEDRWGVHKPLLNPANPEVYTFAEKILGEVVALFPFEYVHIGGDEVDPEHWESNPEIQQFMQAEQLQDSHALHNYFNSRLAQILAGLNRKMIGWDEILHPGLAQTAAVQSWRGPDALKEIARADHYGILSTGFYLDQPQYSSYHYRNHILPKQRTFTQIKNNEPWQSWYFSAPRKRGSALTGTFTIVESTDGKLRGHIKFEGKAIQLLHNIERTGPYTTFKLDTWMGPLRARLLLQDKSLSGDFLVGNTSYHSSGALFRSSSLESEPGYLGSGEPRLSDEQQKNILGGEVALWAEMIDEHNIDLRLWPRAFAVAERLWSGKELQDEDFLYQRLTEIDHWAETAVGLQNKSQQKVALQTLFPDKLQSEALDFSAVLEPAHYYHRHHEKSAKESYSRRDPLNRFADSLPAESIALREFRQLLDYLPANPAVEVNRARLHSGLIPLWRAGVAAEALLKQREQLPADVQLLAERVRQQMELSFTIASRYMDQQAFSDSEAVDIRRQIEALKGMHGEVVLPAVYVLERLMDSLQYSGNNADIAKR